MCITVNVAYVLIVIVVMLLLSYLYLSIFICSSPSTPVTQRMLRGGGRRAERQLREHLKEHLARMKKALLLQSILMVLIGGIFVVLGQVLLPVCSVVMAAIKLFDYRKAPV